MKEFPKFDYNGKSYDLNFYDDSVQIYTVENVMSGVMVSQLITAANDFVAVTGFKNFIEKRKQENDDEVYRLLCVGSLNIEKIEIFDSNKIIIMDSRDDIKKFLDDAKTFMLSWNDDGE